VIIEEEGNLNTDVDTKTYLQMLVSNKSDQLYANCSMLLWNPCYGETG